MKRFAWIVICTLPFGLMLFGQDFSDQLIQVLETYKAENPVAPGVSAYVRSQSNDLEWSGAVGVVQRGGEERLRPDHVIRIASNTKTYVATAILRLVEEGRLDLDQNLSQLLEEDVLAMLRKDNYPVELMTLEHILSHTSGLNEHPADSRYEEALISNPQKIWQPKEQIRLCIEWLDPVGQPGEIYSYSDTGYILLGLILEATTQKKLGPAVRELVNYDQLGLEATFWEYMEPEPSQLERAHQYYADYDITSWHASFDLYGGGGLVSNPKDMGRFMEALLNGRVYKEAKTIEHMKSRGTEPYRLGLMRVLLDGVEAFGHQGFWNTFAYYLPELDLCVAGSITNHHAANGRLLAGQLVKVTRENLAKTSSK